MCKSMNGYSVHLHVHVLYMYICTWVCLTKCTLVQGKFSTRSKLSYFWVDKDDNFYCGNGNDHAKLFCWCGRHFCPLVWFYTLVRELITTTYTWLMKWSSCQWFGSIHIVHVHVAACQTRCSYMYRNWSLI